MSQLVKYKDTGLYLQLYISKNHEENIHYAWGNKEVATIAWSAD